MPDDFLTILGRNIQHLQLIRPELIVAAGFILGMIFDVVVEDTRRRTTGYVCMLALLLALMASVIDLNSLMLGTSTTSEEIFSGMILRDSYGAFFKLVLLLGTIITILVGLHARELFGANHGEFFLLLMATCLGGMFLVSANHLLMIYLSLETLSIVSYALAGFLPQNRKSAEAGIKYVIYGAMASGIMIFGMSYLYGLTGSMDLAHVARETMRIFADPTLEMGARGGVLAVLGMVFCGLLYKIAAAPFHYWSPDVYEGAPTTATAFFSVVPKTAGFAVLLRVLAEFFPLGMPELSSFNYEVAGMVIGAISLVTMLIGNLAALGQSNAKRLLAYSSIAHAGYMLAGLTVLQAAGGGAAAAVLFYLVVYLFMNLGAFLVLIGLENARGSCQLEDLRGSVHQQPFLAVALVVFLFSLTGLPPLAGFMGKYLIMAELAQNQNWFMVIFIGVNSVISLYYYMRLAKAVTIDRPATEAGAQPVSTSPTYAILASAQIAALILLFVYPDPVMTICRKVLEPLAL